MTPEEARRSDYKERMADLQQAYDILRLAATSASECITLEEMFKRMGARITENMPQAERAANEHIHIWAKPMSRVAVFCALCGVERSADGSDFT